MNDQSRRPRRLQDPGVRTCEVCGAEPAARVASCLLAQPISVAYGQRCLAAGVEAWWVCVATISVCVPGDDAHSWRAYLAPFAEQIITRSMTFHGKSETQLLTELRAIYDAEVGGGPAPSPGDHDVCDQDAW